MARLTRRDFACSVGLSMLCAPFLSLLDPSRPLARAAPKGKAKYLLVFFTNGTDTGAWSPRGSTESNIVFSPMTAGLEPLRSNLILTEKLSSFGTADNHAAPGGLTGQGYSGQNQISVEQFVSDRLIAGGTKTAIPNLVLGGVKSEQQTSFYREGRAIAPIYSPQVAFDTVFGGGTPMPTPSAPVAGPSARRKSVLDVLNAEMKRLSQQLGAEERKKLDLHAASIRQLEARLNGEGGGGGGADCGSLAAPEAPSEDLLGSAMHLELAVAAFACDITRVAAVQFGHHQSTQVSLPDVGTPGDWHNSFIHGDNPRTRLEKLERWLCDRFVAISERLKNTSAPDGNGTLWDQTLLIWARDMGDAVGHNGNDMRFVFSGGAGGYLKFSPQGRYLDGGGQRHMRGLLNVCEAMGISDFDGFGDATASGEDRTPLPFLAA